MEAKDYRFKFYHGEEECPEGVWPVGWKVEREFAANPTFIERKFEIYEETPIGRFPAILRDSKLDDIERASACAFAVGADGDFDLAVEYYLDPEKPMRIAQGLDG